MDLTIYEKTSGGLPSSTEFDSLTNRPKLVVSFTRAAMWGPLRAKLGYRTTLAEAFWMADRALGNKVVIRAPGGGLWLWEGLVWAVRFGTGSRARVRTLEGFANLIRVHYNLKDFSTNPPKDLGVGTPVVAQDTTLQDTYGIIEANVRAGARTTAMATTIAANKLRARQRLLWATPNGAMGRTARQTEITVELDLVGFWRTLGYQSYNATTTGTAELRTVIATMLASGKAPFISTDTTWLDTTGVSTRQSFSAYETPSQIIKKLLPEATGYVFRLGENAVPYLTSDHRADASPTYTELEDGTILNAARVAVPAWRVEPDVIVRQEDFLPATTAPTEALDQISSFYAAEVTWSSAQPEQISYATAIAGRNGRVKVV